MTIPDDVRQKFPRLVELILGSESMNDEERQYWVNILPIMTSEQVQNLTDILENEKTQLAAIDAKYSREINAVADLQSIEAMERDRREKAAKRRSSEEEYRKQEAGNAESVLQQIEGNGSAPSNL